MPDLRAQLHDCLRGRVTFLGLGNPEAGDDGFGVRLAARLTAAGVPGVLDAGTAPEFRLLRAVDAGCDHLVFLDAVDFGGAPGSVVFLDAAAIAARFPQISTHKISLGLLAQAAESAGTTRAWLLGVQPASLRPAAALTPAVATTLELLAKLLIEHFGDAPVPVTNDHTPRPVGHPSPRGDFASRLTGIPPREGWRSAGQQSAGVCQPDARGSDVLDPRRSAEAPA